LGHTASTAATERLPISASGPFSDRGFLTLRSNDKRTAGSDTLDFAHGAITVYHANVGSGGVILDHSTCKVKFTQPGVFHVLSSTKAYKGVKGHGTFSIIFTGTLPRLKSGKCDTSPNANVVSGTQLTTFRASGAFTLP
jgi:hypothetical protein